MKRHLLFILVMVMLGFFPSLTVAQNIEPVELLESEVNPTHFPGGFPKSPISIPSIFIDDHTLYFETPCDGCTLNIVDSNDVVVYTTVIPTGATSLVLPSSLSGTYTIQIIRGNYLFYGTIDLL